MNRQRRSRCYDQGGVASLFVVMVLFFVVALAAAYTNRNLIFEQRTSANQYVATQAHEAAQAGLDWALAMLNSGRIDENCEPSTAVGDDSFRQRHLQMDASTGNITPIQPGGNPLYATCYQNLTTGAWTCSCPKTGIPSFVSTPVGPAPSFQVRFWRVPPPKSPPPGAIRLEVVGCLRYDTACLDHANVSGAEGRARLSTQVALYPAVKTLPGAALAVRGNVDVNAAGSLTAYNGDVESGGVALQVGGNTTASSGPIVAYGPGGTPSAQALVTGDRSLADAALAPAGPFANAEDRLFGQYFGIAPATYFDQPAAFRITGATTSTAVQTAANNHPLRPIIINGNLTIDSDIGSTAQPVALIVNGDVTFSSGATMHGLLYVRSTAATWTTVVGTGTVRGSAVAHRSYAGSATLTFVRESDTLRRLQTQQGSFVVVPGSWKDYSL